MTDRSPIPFRMRPSAATKRLILRAAAVAACALLAAAASLSPLLLHRMQGLTWSELSDVGQAYGTLAAVLTALTFSAVAVSVFLQAREVRTAREHGTRLIHLELVRMVIDDPRLQMWSAGTADDTRRQQYANLWVMLWKALFCLGDMSEQDLRATVYRDFFDDCGDAEFGRRFWRRSRCAYLTNAKNRKERRFYEIIEDVYQKSLAETAHTTSTSHKGDRAATDSERLTTRTMWNRLILGGAIGLAAGYAIASRDNGGPKKMTLTRPSRRNPLRLRTAEGLIRISAAPVVLRGPEHPYMFTGSGHRSDVSGPSLGMH